MNWIAPPKSPINLHELLERSRVWDKKTIYWKFYFIRYSDLEIFLLLALQHTMASVKIYFWGERYRRSKDRANCKARERRNGGTRKCALPGLVVRGYKPRKIFENFHVNLLHFGAFWCRFGGRKEILNPVFFIDWEATPRRSPLVPWDRRL